MKTYSLKIDPLTNEEYIEVALRGEQLLHDPFLNKGSSFTEEERLSLGLTGLLRSSVSGIETQRARSYEMYSRKHDNIEKYIEEILTQMAKNTERSIIFALWNPTSKSECTPEEVAEATKGKGFVAMGSPFTPFQYEGKEFVT